MKKFILTIACLSTIIINASEITSGNNLTPSEIKDKMMNTSELKTLKYTSIKTTSFITQCPKHTIIKGNLIKKDGKYYNNYTSICNNNSQKIDGKFLLDVEINTYEKELLPKEIKKGF